VKIVNLLRNRNFLKKFWNFPVDFRFFFSSRSLESAVQEINWRVNEVALECSG
jgi:hypothetical protein